jgi:Kdo2-lipid IVA lauroyltransferase/acyltransferase
VTSRQTDAIAFGCGRGLGAAAHALVRRRRAIALANLRQALGGEKDDAELRAICRASFAHLGVVFAEFLLLPSLSGAQLLERFRVTGLEHVQSARASGRGLVLITAHVGNWEWLCAAQAQLGVGAVIVTRHAHVGAVDRFWQQRRARSGVEVVDSFGSLPQILGLLRAGRPVGLAIDQHEGGTGAARVPFLGRDAGTTRTPALLAARTGCAVLPAWSWRDDGGLHHATFGPEIPLREGATLEETIALTTRDYNAWLEGVVRAHPEQWLWVHRRWKPA